MAKALVYDVAARWMCREGFEAVRAESASAGRFVGAREGRTWTWRPFGRIEVGWFAWRLWWMGIGA